MSDESIRGPAIAPALHTAEAAQLPPRGRTIDRDTPSRFLPDLQLVALVTVTFKEPVMLGRSPEGLRIDFHAQQGIVRGQDITARVRENSADYMVVRRDGIGLLCIRATLETDDGALIAVEETGLIDFGEDGFARIAAGDFPERPRLQSSLKLLTEHRKYRWMNRIAFLGVGHASVKERLLRYDLFAVRTHSLEEG